MQYFFDEVLPEATIGVFLPFPDGKISAGVWKEAVFLKKKGSQVYEINLDGNIALFDFDESRKLSVAETRAKLKK